MKIGSFSPEMVETSDRKWESAPRVRVVYSGEYPVFTEDGAVLRGAEGAVTRYAVTAHSALVEWDAGFACSVDVFDLTII